MKLSRTGGRAWWIGVLIPLFTLLWVGTPPMAAAASAPAWQLTAQPFPSNFAPGRSAEGEGENGPAFLVTARNVGGTSTSGETEIEAELPEGLVLAEGPIGAMSFGDPMSCSGNAGDRLAKCGTSVPIAAGDNVRVVLPVTVEATETSPPSVLELHAVVRGGGAAETRTTALVPISTAITPFGFLSGPVGFFGSLTDAKGGPPTQAGSVPFQMTIGLGFPWYFLNTEAASGGGLRNAEVVLPRGFVVNPAATASLCRAGQLEHLRCPADSQVGTAQPIASLGTLPNSSTTKNVYNLVPAPGVPAEFGFEAGGGVVIHLRGKVRSNGEYALAAVSQDVLAKVQVGGAVVTLWGVPSDPAHDGMRGPCGDKGTPKAVGECPLTRAETTARTGRAFVSVPADCDQRGLSVSGQISSWQAPTEWKRRQFTFEDASGNAIQMKDCAMEPFSASIEAEPTTHKADSPSGLEFDVHQSQLAPFEEIAPAPLRDISVTLPPGLTVDPASADGLAGCTEQEMGVEPSAGGRIAFSEEAQSCPDGSKLGEVSVTTPLLRHALPGAVYLAKPYDNPFGSLLALYIAVEDEHSGIISKLAGEVQANPINGQLSASFRENPELPLEDVRLKLFDGNRASLQTPPSCGMYATASRLTPWSSPEGADITPSSPPFAVTENPGPGACPTQESAAPNSPSLSAGTLTPRAGAYSPFILTMSRADGTQRLGGVEATLPPGVSGKLAGIPYCSEGKIAAAKAREAPNQGALEIASPSCPAASEVGTVTVGAGAGPTPLYVQGHAYLAGPYKGAPLSLVIITPAVAGPFDLGAVVVRTALNINSRTAQVRAVSDPLPSIIDGIPLDIRSITVNLNKPEFTLNPTSCNALSVLVHSSSTLGQDAQTANRFQVGGCSELGFKPKFSLTLKGATKRTGHPAVKAVVTYPENGKYANIARAQVGLPGAEFLDQGNLNKVCKQAELQSATCPKTSIYGHVRLWTPLLAEPLEGPVYLGVGYGYKLPALVAELNGQIRVLLVGRIDTTKQKGIRSTFEVVPDAPVSRFVLQMKGGKKYGLLENSENVCKRTRRVNVRLVAQNGGLAQLHPPIKYDCGKAGRKSEKRQQSKH